MFSTKIPLMRVSLSIELRVIGNLILLTAYETELKFFYFLHRQLDCTFYSKITIPPKKPYLTRRKRRKLYMLLGMA